MKDPPIITVSMSCVKEYTSNLWQFICRSCPGKFEHHKYRVWHERVSGPDPKSKCHVCNKMKPAVPRKEEEGVHICHFECNCGSVFVVRCEMQDTAPCYECGVMVAPCHFQPLRRINRKTNRTHNCSKCNGQPGCPNMTSSHLLTHKL